MSTRPRISFDSSGRCNACTWAIEKASLDWTARRSELLRILEGFRGKSGDFDCIVPVSGGKDGSYVAYQLRDVYGMNPLTVTVRPDLETELGRRNLDNFIKSGFDHVHISPNALAMRRLNQVGFCELGFPYFGWLLAIHTAVLQAALAFNVSLIFYGEDGEVEYGGSTETSSHPEFDSNYMRRIYVAEGTDRVLARSELSPSQTVFFRFPPDSDLRSRVKILHWSYFENWDPYRNFLVARDHCGYVESRETNVGTFTNFAQNDQLLYPLHTYLMYLKFGFGRATQDAGIEIRRGAMSRDQGRALAEIYDGFLPEELIERYLDYFEMSRDDFDKVLASFANRDLFEFSGGRWQPNFRIQ